MAQPVTVTSEGNYIKVVITTPTPAPTNRIFNTYMPQICYMRKDLLDVRAASKMVNLRDQRHVFDLPEDQFDSPAGAASVIADAIVQMSNSNDYLWTVFENLPATINQISSSSPLACSGYKNLHLQIVLSGIVNPPGTIKLQESNDGTNWTDISGASVNLTGSGIFTIDVDNWNAKYVRANYAFTGITSGTIDSCTIEFK